MIIRLIPWDAIGCMEEDFADCFGLNPSPHVPLAHFFLLKIDIRIINYMASRVFVVAIIKQHSS